MRSRRRPLAGLTCALGIALSVGAPAATASFPGADGLLAFEHEGDIWVTRPDGSDQRRLVANAWQPAWSPDGRRLAFTRGSVQGDQGGVYVVGADGRHAVLIGPELGSPAWAPDGRHLATTTGSSGLRVIGDDGSDPRDVRGPGAGTSTPDPGEPSLPPFETVGGEPAWSPDGTTIAFALNPFEWNPSTGIWGVAPDGTGFRYLRAGDEEYDQASEPDWAPDSASVAFTLQGHSYGTRIVGAETGQPAAVFINEEEGFRPLLTGSPAHAPDGDGLAYTSDRAGYSTDLWVHDGAGTRRVVADAAHPDWQPLLTPDCARLAPDPWILRPVDHRLHRVEVATPQTGIDVAVTRVRVSEPPRGSRGPDYVREKAKNIVDLRADRNVAGRGRTYLLDVRATGSGGSCTTRLKVVVPGGADWSTPVLPQPADHWYPADGA